MDIDSCSATGAYGVPTATDNCESVEVTLTEGLASGSEFPLGEPTVTFPASYAAGNEVNPTFTVTVVDEIAPVGPNLADVVGECEVTLTAPTTNDN